MSRSYKLTVVIVVTLSAFTSLFFFPALPQSLSYHNFANKREIWSIPNFLNVISNIPFLIVGTAGLILLYCTQIPSGKFAMYFILFAGILLTGFGSAFYHWHPDNNTLVWDRIPMTLEFMALTSATVAELINLKLGTQLLVPLVLLGIFSVDWWHHTEKNGNGDLRLYGFVQFYPMILLAILLFLFYDRKHKVTMRYFLIVMIWYVLEKFLETYDGKVYSLAGISGHTFKHIAAAMATWHLVVLFRLKYLHANSIKENVFQAYS